MRNHHLPRVRVLCHALCLSALAFAPTLVNGQAVTLVQSGARFAGSGASGFNTDFGSATTVDITPSNLVFDSLGNQYVSDAANNCVRKITPTGTASTIVGLAVGGSGDTCNIFNNSTPTPTQGLYQPIGLAVDSSNNLYIADSKHNCVRELPHDATGVASLTTVAGTCGSTPSSTPSPSGLAIDASNNLYIAIHDVESTPALSTYQVLRLLPSSGLCVMAGSPSALVPSLCSGVTSNVVLKAPSGIALDATGDLFIADTGNNCVREVAGLTTQQTAVGQCSNDLTGNSATALNSPENLAFSATQFLFITEANASANNVVSYALGSSAFTIVAGLPSGAPGPYNTTQDGKSALSSPLNAPLGIAVDTLGNFYVADSGNYIIRKFSSDILFPPTTVGSPSPSVPITFAISQNVNLSAAVGADFRITSNSCTGALTATPAGTPPFTCQVFVSFNPSKPGVRSAPLRLDDSLSGQLLGLGLQAIGIGPLSVFTPGTVNTVVPSLTVPIAVAVDSTGNVYILESGTGSGSASLLLLPVSGGSPLTLIAPGGGLLTPSALALDAAGNIYIADKTQNTVTRYGIDSVINPNYVTGLDSPTALYVDSFDNLYIAQAGASHNVVEFYLSGIRRVVAGSGTVSGANGVPATTATFVSPSSLYVDLNNILYIADGAGHLVYAVDNTGLIHQVAGNGTTSTTAVGQATGTALLNPASISVDAAGDLYIADSAANLIYTVFTGTTSTGANIAISLGTGTAGNTGDGGLATLAQISNPLGVAVDSSADIFVADNGNNSIREVTYPNPTINFGTILVGQTSPLVMQSVSDFGTASVTLTTPFATSDSHFVVSPSATTCGSAISPGSTCNLGFTFAPTQNGPVNGNSTLLSNSPNSPQVIQLIGNGKVPQPLTFTLTAQTEVYGQPFPESVSIANGDPAPTGTIAFTTGTQTLCTLNGAFAASTTCNAPNSGLAIGNYPVIFNYSGDTIYPSSTLSTTLTVTPAPLTVTVNNATRAFGAPNPTFTGTITGTLPGDTITATYSTTATATSPAGNYPITATLTAGGTTNLSNYTITNTPGTLTITPAAAPADTTTTLTSSGSPVVAGTNVTFTATVTTTTGVPSGVVVFSDGTTVLGQQTLNASGVATFSTTSLTAGTHTITATLQASPTFASSTGTLTQVVTAVVGSFTLAVTPPSQYVRGAGSTIYQVSITSVGAFADQVTLACSGLPADAVCSFSSSPTLTAGGTATATLTITNTAADAALRSPAGFNPTQIAPLTAAAIFPIELTGLGVLFSGFRRRKPRSTQRLRILALFLCTIGILGLTACCTTTTTFKTYTVTVTGTSPTAAAQSTTVLLSVGN
jgi:MBG domain (YGX type)/Bacterial Ig-like domain (group 3)/NHL repeat